MPLDPERIGEWLGMLGGLAGGGGGKVWPQFRAWVTALGSSAAMRWPAAVSAGARCHARCQEPAVAVCGVCGLPSCLHHAAVMQDADVVCSECIAELRRHHGAWKKKAATGDRRGAPRGYADAQANHHRRYDPPPPPPTGEGFVDQFFKDFFRRAPPGGNGGTGHPGFGDPAYIAAMSEIGMPYGAPWSEVQARFKKIVVELHPDREQQPHRKAEKEQRLKRVLLAYEVLKKSPQYQAAQRVEARP